MKTSMLERIVTKEVMSGRSMCSGRRHVEKCHKKVANDNEKHVELLTS